MNIYMNMTAPLPFSSIPTIDLSLADSPATKPALLQKLHYALVSVGFLYVSNHGVPENVIADLANVLPQLFSLPEAAKDEIALRNSPHFLGYSRVGTETTGGKADRREQVEFATELDVTYGPGKPLYERLRGLNQWPSRLPTVKPIVQSYISHLTSLGERFLHLVAEALALPPQTFLPFLSDQHRLKLVRYPGTTAPTADSGETPTQGVGPHKDSSGWWTFLLQASPPSVKGLQALNKAGGWIDVPCVPGTFVVNIGQAFEVVTNGVCKATTHRVVMEPGSAERFSVPFFQGVRGDLTKEEALGRLKEFWEVGLLGGSGGDGGESEEGRGIDSPFLRGEYDTWGESQLRTKVRSHRDVGKRFYGDVFERYVNDD
ncbi:oxidoreductase [Blastomyces dermatitidis ER-3]|uniref:Oxidoreductase n=1 Tax=Ajellomyces dermatitidis (strain ER-3 / ATCC MYA-2586) TaxID=559297 RepID=A0ABP2ES86_AJEDR|nr:oxidoreductase [Blastomyces dermatitidis ER-3]EEQ86172.2 oxidoreductase [Blastomyces dermatitidis ER-3]